MKTTKTEYSLEIKVDPNGRWVLWLILFALLIGLPLLLAAAESMDKCGHITC